MTTWDLTLAESLLAGPLPRRWQHSLGVRRQALTLTATPPGADDEILVAAATLHDVGYAPSVAVTGFHPLDGAVHLQELGIDDRIVRLVANHSCAVLEAEQRGLVDQLAKFPPLEDPRLVDALIWADMTTTPDGAVTTVGERITEIRSRYGDDSLVGRFIHQADPHLRDACSRTHLTPSATS